MFWEPIDALVLLHSPIFVFHFDLVRHMYNIDSSPEICKRYNILPQTYIFLSLRAINLRFLGGTVPRFVICLPWSVKWVERACQQERSHINARNWHYRVVIKSSSRRKKALQRPAWLKHLKTLCLVLKFKGRVLKIYTNAFTRILIILRHSNILYSSFLFNRYIFISIYSSKNTINGNYCKN